MNNQHAKQFEFELENLFSKCEQAQLLLNQQRQNIRKQTESLVTKQAMELPYRPLRVFKT